MSGQGRRLWLAAARQCSSRARPAFHQLHSWPTSQRGSLTRSVASRIRAGHHSVMSHGLTYEQAAASSPDATLSALRGVRCVNSEATKRVVHDSHGRVPASRCALSRPAARTSPDGPRWRRSLHSKATSTAMITISAHRRCRKCLRCSPLSPLPFPVSAERDVPAVEVQPGADLVHEVKPPGRAREAPGPGALNKRVLAAALDLHAGRHVRAPLGLELVGRRERPHRPAVHAGDDQLSTGLAVNPARRRGRSLSGGQ